MGIVSRSQTKKRPHFSHRSGGYVTAKDKVLEFLEKRIDDAVYNIMRDVRGHGHPREQQEQLEVEFAKVEEKIKKMLKSCGVSNDK